MVFLSLSLSFVVICRDEKLGTPLCVCVLSSSAAIYSIWYKSLLYESITLGVGIMYSVSRPLSLDRSYSRSRPRTTSRCVCVSYSHHIQDVARDNSMGICKEGSRFASCCCCCCDDSNSDGYVAQKAFGGQVAVYRYVGGHVVYHG